MGQTHLFRIFKPRSSNSQDHQLHPRFSFPAPSPRKAPRREELFCHPLWALRNRTSCFRLCSNLSWLVTGWVTLGKFLNLSVPQFPQSKSKLPRVPEPFQSSVSTCQSGAQLWAPQDGFRVILSMPPRVNSTEAYPGFQEKGESVSGLLTVGR